jgi:hypothetical protein
MHISLYQSKIYIHTVFNFKNFIRAFPRYIVECILAYDTIKSDGARGLAIILIILQEGPYERWLEYAATGFINATTSWVGKKRAKFYNIFTTIFSKSDTNENDGDEGNGEESLPRIEGKDGTA